MIIKLIPLDATNYRYKYEPLDMSCVEPHLRSLISEGDIKKYNASLPTNEEVDQYINKLAKYQRIQNNGIAFNLQISNDGTAKATDVRVFVDFPEEFLIFDVSDIEDIDAPKAPTLPNNPIDQAEHEYERRVNPPVAFVNRPLVEFNNFNLPSKISSLEAKLNSSNTVFSNHSLSIDDHGITANAKQIPHKDLEWFRDIYIVPTAKGHFQIRVSLMCSEYIEPEESLIDIEVV